MGVNDGQASTIIEYLVLVIVLLATISLNEAAGGNEENTLELTHISGNMILSTRSSMDGLGLYEFQRGARASVEMNVSAVISEGCDTCSSVPEGVRLNGTVVITELIDDAGRLGKVEATLEVIYLYESIKSGFISKEWVRIDWDAGPASSQWDIIITHDPPRWVPEGRDNAAFISIDEGHESRNGPWLFAKDMMSYSQNIIGCIPTSFTCDGTTQHEFNFTSSFEQKRAPITIPHVATWAPIQTSVNMSGTPVLMEDVRELLTTGEKRSDSTPWCPIAINGEALASWEMSSSNGINIAPMSTILSATGLPSGSFSPIDGMWTEIENADEACASAIDEQGILIIGIYKHNA